LNALTNNTPNRRTFILQSVTGLSAVAVVALGVRLAVGIGAVAGVGLGPAAGVCV